MNTSPADCCAEPSRKLLSVEEGRARILDSLQPVEGVERLPLKSATGRILAQDIVSAIDVPCFANSAMDGYAVRSQDCPGEGDTVLEVVGSSFAGAPFEGAVGRGQCVRIMTGAVVPEGADAVLMQERVEREDERIRFASGSVEAGLNVRYPGEDTRRGDTVLECGKRLGAAEIALLASVGVGEVPLRRRLRVAFFSTGDELTSLGQPLEAGQIYDSNRYALSAMLSAPRIEYYDLGVIPDRRDAVRDAFRQAGAMADLVLTSGGVSVGEADYVTETLAELGQIDFWRMAMKPGKPLAFGRLGAAVFFGLPGNPVSAMVTFYQFVLPAIRKMSGEKARAPLLLQARCAGDLRKAPGRMEFQRGILQTAADGSLEVSTTGLQGSHVLSSMSRANCFIHLPAESSGAHRGEMVTVQPFADLGY
ncbi:MAG TPA: molybdopterin molybdenumtransferase MoeA [Gammaproteobacteria bacterium]|nr:molybdopterin molybdenumtransferase MoeA [Gammaproteobacteria bacterium]